ncbi:MAG: hypothetical protein K2W94_07695 [Alphaproteobacteria bacterium]|nr:hypothetical protein [Alphaproteobacteria bacterium]
MRCLRNVLVRFLKFWFRALKAFLGLLGLRSFIGKIARRRLNVSYEETDDLSQNLIDMTELNDVLYGNYAPDELIDIIAKKGKLYGNNHPMYKFVSKATLSYYRKNKDSHSLDYPTNSENIKKMAEPLAGFPDPIFTVAVPTRMLNNIDHKLPTLLYCLYVNSLVPKNFEILLAVDADDDLEYFFFIQEIFNKKLNIRVIVGGEKRGYRNLHFINGDLMPHRSPTSGGVLSLTDDTCINKHFWDVEIISLVVARPKQIYMAHPIPNLHCMFKEGMEFSQFLSSLSIFGPRSVLFFLSSEMLKQLDYLTADKSGWCSFGNSVMCDSFFDILSFLTEHEYNTKLIAPMQGIGQLFEQSELCEHKEGGIFGESPVFSSTFPLLYNIDSLNIIRQMAESLAKNIRN